MQTYQLDPSNDRYNSDVCYAICGAWYKTSTYNYWIIWKMYVFIKIYNSAFSSRPLARVD